MFGREKPMLFSRFKRRDLQTPRIFISYRRVDTEALAHRLHRSLQQASSKDLVFLDSEAIQPGTDWLQTILTQVKLSDYMLVLIGSQWLDAVDDGGTRRLDRHDDIVLNEILAGLVLGKRILPLLVDGAQMPHMEQLPKPIKMLCRYNALPLRSKHFRDDINKIKATITKSPLQSKAFVASGSANKRAALVVGNSEYRSLPSLASPRIEASVFADTLAKCGFQVNLVIDAARAELSKSMYTLREHLRTGGVGLLFYSGHVARARGRHFLVPTDCEASADETSLLDTQMAFEAELASKSWIVEKRGLVEFHDGLAIPTQMHEAPGSIFVRQFVNIINSQRLELLDLLRATVDGVAIETQGAQLPWFASCSSSKFYFLDAEPDALIDLLKIVCISDVGGSLSPLAVQFQSR
jgi:hypothetical protein